MNNEEKRLIVRRIISQIAESKNVMVVYRTPNGCDYTEVTFYYGGEEARKYIYWDHVVDNAKEYTTYRLLRCIEETIEHLKEDVDNTKTQIITSHNPYAERKVEENMDVASWYPKTIMNSIYGSRAFAKYVENDLKSTTPLWERVKADILKGNYCYGKIKPTPNKIKKVIFNPPATIVFWMDGTKTVVKAHDEDYDPEKGMAMAFSKKFLGNNHEYYDIFKHWLKKFDKQFTVFKKVLLTKEDVIAPWKGVDLPKLELDLDKERAWQTHVEEVANAILSKPGDLVDWMRKAQEKHPELNVVSETCEKCYEEARKHDLIQQVYDILVSTRDTVDESGKMPLSSAIDLDVAIGYLGEVLDD